jgi:hypothetical protein
LNQQPELYDIPLSPDPYPADQTGPVCPQVSLDPDGIDHLVKSKTEDLAGNILGVIFEMFSYTDIH